MVPSLFYDGTLWDVYRAILSDIADDIEWLRRNPAYYEIGSDIFPYMQNAMITEALGMDKALNRTTLVMMCEAFVGNTHWDNTEESTIRQVTIQRFAEKVCADA